MCVEGGWQGLNIATVGQNHCHCGSKSLPLWVQPLWVKIACSRLAEELTAACCRERDAEAYRRRAATSTPMHSTSSAGGLLLGLLTRSSEAEKARPEDEEDPPTFGDDCAFPLRCECVVAGRVPLPCPPRAGQVADSGGRLIERVGRSIYSLHRLHK